MGSRIGATPLFHTAGALNIAARKKNSNKIYQKFYKQNRGKEQYYTMTSTTVLTWQSLLCGGEMALGPVPVLTFCHVWKPCNVCSRQQKAVFGGQQEAWSGAGETNEAWAVASGKGDVRVPLPIRGGAQPIELAALAADLLLDIDRADQADANGQSIRSPRLTGPGRAYLLDSRGLIMLGKMIVPEDQCLFRSSKDCESLERFPVVGMVRLANLPLLQITSHFDFF